MPNNEPATTTRGPELGPISIRESDSLVDHGSEPEPAESLRQKYPIAWWLSLVILGIGIGGSLLLSMGTADLPSRLGELSADIAIILVIAWVIDWIVGRFSSTARPAVLLFVASVGAVALISSDYEQYAERTRLIVSVASTTAKAIDGILAKSQGENRAAQNGAVAAKGQETNDAGPNGGVSGDQPWTTMVSAVVTEHLQANIDMAAKYRADVAALQLDRMLYDNLQSSEGRRLNRQNLIAFEKLISTLVVSVEALLQEYRRKMLAIDLPAADRKTFEQGSVGQFATIRGRYAEFVRVEHEIVGVVLNITDLFEMERDRVKFDTGADTVAFENQEALTQYNMLMGRLRELAAEEMKFIAENRDELQKTSEALKLIVK